jgi:site-specific DNA-methyltransferase (adenine-specific)
VIELHCGDCLDVLRGIQGRRIDAVVADPPYGIKNRGNYTRFSGANGKASWTKSGDFRPIVGDDRPFDPTPFLAFPKVILWGANFYSDRLPGGGWLVWCKKRANKLGKFLGDCEMAWNKTSKATYLFHHEWDGLIRESERGKSLHPTQKPVALMRWCLQRLNLKPGATVFDPYMGSGTVGIAAAELGLHYIGCEIDPEYHAIARRRIAAASAA